MSESAKGVADRLRMKFFNKTHEVLEDKRGVVVKLSVGDLVDALNVFKNDPHTPFDMLVGITAIDWLNWTEETGFSRPAERYSLTYNLYSISKMTRLFLEVAVAEGSAAPSVVSLYASANWAEREVFDMFGIRFTGHPELKRIYLPEDFLGHPLQKDFPLHGNEPQDFPQE